MAGGAAVNPYRTVHGPDLLKAELKLAADYDRLIRLKALMSEIDLRDWAWINEDTNRAARALQEVPQALAAAIDLLREMVEDS